MKRRKTLFLSAKALARGEQLAAEAGKSFSALVEEQLLAIPSVGIMKEDYWAGRTLKPLSRPGDKRMRYLKRKHG